MIVLSIISCMALLFSRYYPKKNEHWIEMGFYIISFGKWNKI